MSTINLYIAGVSSPADGAGAGSNTNSGGRVVDLADTIIVYSTLPGMSSSAAFILLEKLQKRLC
jgi:hypothetical protein